jgi:hypothetical protein
MINCLYAQTQFSGTGTYTQNFGTSAKASLNDNTTFTGWYFDNCNYVGTENITTAAPSDQGGLYTYQSNGTGQLLVGFRPSDTQPGGPCGGGCAWDGTASTTNSYACYIGLRIKNYSTLAVKSMQISFDWYQLSLAPNNSNTNIDYVDYQVGNTENDPTSGSWTEITALKFTAPKSSGTCCSNQIQGYPWSGVGANPQKLSVSTLAVITIPAGKEIMLRWYDPNNADDDPHMGFGNVSLAAFSDAGGTVALPISLINFDAQYNTENKIVNIYWTTATEVNNKSFTIEKTLDGVNWENVAVISGAGNSTHNISYSTTDDSPYSGVSYYRIKQTDFDGTDSYPGGAVSVNVSDMDLRDIAVSPNPTKDNATFTFKSPEGGEGTINIINTVGKLIEAHSVSLNKGTTTTTLNVSGYASGMYYVIINNNLQQLTTKFVVNHN